MIFGKNKSDKHYKFNSLQVYAWDRSVGSKKKFRRLFDRYELNYLSSELSIYNKLFDEEDWEAEIVLVANRLLGYGKVEKLCEKKETVTISKEDNTFEYSFGWGSDDRGSFWILKLGCYRILISAEFSPQFNITSFVMFTILLIDTVAYGKNLS